MQSFRARSQLLAETLEENDNVLQTNLNQTFNVDDAIEEELLEVVRNEEENAEADDSDDQNR